MLTGAAVRTRPAGPALPSLPSSLPSSLCTFALFFLCSFVLSFLCSLFLGTPWKGTP
ncbi:hypothetical protein HMPREF1211_04789 [Streptomyces sp. HGB0020]|nr:hypothetical protein HMPREF1211_04789 [Streptomyces sp. HGB0020]